MCWIATVGVVYGAVVSPGHMRGNPTTHDRGGLVRTGEAVGEQGLHYALNVYQVKIPPRTAGSADPLVLGRQTPKNDALVPLVGHWLAHVLQKLAIAVQDVNKNVGIFAGLYLRILQLFVLRPPSLLCVAVALLFQVIPRRLPVTNPNLPGLAHMRLYVFAKRSVVTNRILEWFASTRVHIATAVELCAALGIGSA